MEQQRQHLDLRTLLVIMAEEDVPMEKIVDLIANEVDVPSDKLHAIFSGVSRRQPQREITAFSRPEEKKTTGKRSYSHWEDKRLNELVERWNRGQKPGQIAKEMGVSTQTVYQKISRLRKERDDIQTRQSRNPAFRPQTSKAVQMS